MFSPILHDAFIQATVDERLRHAELQRVRSELRRSRRREAPTPGTSRRARGVPVWNATLELWRAWRTS
jgi:hypothetical protein